MEKVYVLRYMNGEKSVVGKIIGFSEKYDEIITAGERAYKELTGEKKFYWTNDHGNVVRFYGKNGKILTLQISEEKLDSDWVMNHMFGVK